MKKRSCTNLTLVMPLFSCMATRSPSQMNFEEQFRALIHFHLEADTAGRHPIQALEAGDFARNHIAPPGRASGQFGPRPNAEEPG